MTKSANDYWYGVLIESAEKTGPGTYVHFDDVAHDTLEAAISEARSFRHFPDTEAVALIRISKASGATTTMYDRRQLELLFDNESEQDARDAAVYGTYDQQVRNYFNSTR